MGRPPESEVYVRESSSPDPIEAPCTSGDVDGGGWLDLVPPERGPRIEIIDRLVQPDGRTGYQSLQPRGPNAWIVEAFDGVVLRLRSDGCFECQVRTDPEGSRGLRGDWTRNGDRVRITAEERTPGGFDVWLDGFLDRRGQDGAHDTWSLDALFSGGGGFTRLLARVRQPMTSSPLPPDFAGRIEHDGPLAPGRPSELAPAVCPVDAVWPVFDVTLTVTEGFPSARTHAGTILFALSPDDPTRFTLAMSCHGSVGAGWLHWSVAGLMRDATEPSIHVRHDSASVLPTWYGEESIPLPLRDAELHLTYLPNEFSITGSVCATGTDGTDYSAAITGKLHNPEVEALRNELHRLGLGGSWQGASGPVSSARLPGGAYAAELGSITATMDGALVVPGRRKPYGLLHHARAEDLAVGLIGPPENLSLIILVRADPPFDLTRFGAADAESLRHLAQSTLADGLTATARPLTGRAEALLDSPTEAAWVSRMLMLNFQVRADFELRDYGALLSHLRAAVQLRQRVLFEASPWGAAARSVRAGLASCRSMLDTLETGSPPVRTAVARLNDVDEALDASPESPTEPAETAASTLALVKALRAGSDELNAFSRAELSEDADLLGPGLAEERADLLHRALLVDPGNTREFIELQRQEEHFLAGVHRRQEIDARRRAEYLHRYHTAVTLRLVALAFQQSSEFIERSRLPEAVGDRIRLNRQGATQLTSYLEQWRRLLEHDWDRIQAVERSQPFYADLVRLLLDIRAPGDALVASELGRARAFADLMAETPDVRPEVVAAPDLSVATLTAACAELGRTVIEYLVLDDELITWLIRPSGEMSVHRRALSRDRLAAAVADFHNLAATERPTPADAVAMEEILTRLGEDLWWHLPADALPEDPDESVTLIPHGPLFRVPFAALRDADHRYLAESHALVLSPAAALLPQLSARRRARGRPMAKRCVALVNPPPLPTMNLHRLTLTERHFGAVTAFYEPGCVVVHSGTAASLSALRECPPDTDVIIFATHAKALDAPGEDPMSSFIALAPSPDHDGMLRAWEVIELDLGAHLVILNACETGAGLVTGDGIIGLSRAFLANGPSTLLMTLYEVGERFSLDVLHLFHTYWKGEGMSAAAALRKAQCELCETLDGQPRLWAPFVLFGLDTETEEA